MSREKLMASIDIGSQSVQMLLARIRADGKLELINEFVATTRLCDSMNPEGAFSEEAMDKTITAAREMQDIAMKEGASALIVTARSAIREASNRSAFLLQCHQRLNVYPQLLSGKDEARLNYLGASMFVDAQKPLLVLGIGVSSAQLAYGAKGAIERVASVAVGSAALERQHALGLAANILKQKAAAAQIKTEILDFALAFELWSALQGSKPEAVVTGSLANSLAAIVRKQPLLDFKSLELTPCSTLEVFEQYKRLSRMKPKERLAVPGVENGLELNLVSGLFALGCLLESLKVEDFRTSSAGLRAGVLKYFMET